MTKLAFGLLLRFLSFFAGKKNAVASCLRAAQAAWGVGSCVRKARQDRARAVVAQALHNCSQSRQYKPASGMGFAGNGARASCFSCASCCSLLTRHCGRKQNSDDGSSVFRTYRIESKNDDKIAFEIDLSNFSRALKVCPSACFLHRDSCP